MSKRNIAKRIALFAGILVVPVFFIVLFSLGKPSYTSLPYFGEHVINQDDTTFYQVPAFSFTNEHGATINESTFKDQFLVVTILYKTCPYDCNFPFEQFRYFLYDEIVKQAEKFDDVHFISHVIDASPSELKSLKKTLEIIENNWTLVSGEHNAIYDVNLLLKNPWQVSDKKNGYARGAYGLALVLDKDRHIRGVYQINQTSEIKRIENEIVLLKREENRTWYKTD